MFADTSMFLWRPYGVADAELLHEWPWVFQNMLTKPLECKLTKAFLLKAKREIPNEPESVRPLIARITDCMLQHIAQSRAAPVLQARLRRFCVHRRNEQVVAVLGAIHPRLGSQSMLGSMLGEDMLQIVLRGWSHTG